MCPVEKGWFVITDCASPGGQEGDLSAGTRGGSDRQRCETQIWSEKTAQPAVDTRREESAGPFLGGDCPSLSPWCTGG